MRKKIQAHIFKRTIRDYEFLLLKRNKENGSIWQPVTGKVERGEENLETAKREIKEETGISGFSRIIDLEYSFKFKNKTGSFDEYAFGFEVSSSVEDITLSHEHQNYSWVNFETAYELIYWKSNKDVLKLLINKIKPNKQ